MPLIQFNGMKVRQVMNLTDVDDKTIKGANAQGVALTDYTKTYKDAFFADLGKLNVQPAEVYPAATDHIPEMIALVQTLMEKGVAYQSEDGSVYFAVTKFPGYGKLCGQNLEDLESGARIDLDPNKRHPMDFAVWKAQKPGEPAWESPWGMGRPGWHIECSAMSMKYLGETLDIHCGGKDLVFPHHENEIAQSECANGCEFAHYWMHNGFINVDNHKMSKSLNNFFTVRDVANVYGYEPIRYLMVSSQYRSPINYSTDIIEQAKNALERLYRILFSNLH